MISAFETFSVHAINRGFLWHFSELRRSELRVLPPSRGELPTSPHGPMMIEGYSGLITSHLISHLTIDLSPVDKE